MVETKRRITVKKTSIKVNADLKLKLKKEKLPQPYTNQIWKTTLRGPGVVTVFFIHFVGIKLV
jgi:hypothetical protein